MLVQKRNYLQDSNILEGKPLKKKNLKVKQIRSRIMFLLYHNPRCSKSRACLKILNEKKFKFKEVFYLKEGLSKMSLIDIVDKLTSPVSNLIRTSEKAFKQFPFDINDKELVIKFLNKFPICMQRPLF